VLGGIEGRPELMMRYQGREITWDILVEKRFGLRRARWLLGTPRRAWRRLAYSPLGDWTLAQWSRPASHVARRYADNPALLPRTGRIWEKADVLPVPFHFYQPIVRSNDVAAWGAEDPLLGVDMRDSQQLELLSKLARFREEVAALPIQAAPDGSQLYVDLAGQSFLSGDIETLYAMVRHLAPQTVLEVGCGASSRVIELALRANRKAGKPARHICVEPYHAPWLEELGVEVVRERVELLDLEVFSDLRPNDILFIDTSHVVRHGGDVNHLYLRVLPALPEGVYVHVHDIFLPLDYPPEWLRDYKHFWTEQYLLQAFLAFNAQFEVVLAANYLATHHRSALALACPILADEPDSTPGSFWLRRMSARG
jgi:hypothetical protein